MMDDEQLMCFGVHTLHLWARVSVLIQEAFDLLDDTDVYVSGHDWWSTHVMVNRDNGRRPLAPVELRVDGINGTRRRMLVVVV